MLTKISKVYMYANARSIAVTEIEVYKFDISKQK